MRVRQEANPMWYVDARRAMHLAIRVHQATQWAEGPAESDLTVGYWEAQRHQHRVETGWWAEFIPRTQGWRFSCDECSWYIAAGANTEEKQS